MSTRELFADLYFDAQRELVHQRDLVAYYRCRLDQCEGQRLSLMSMVRSTAVSLEENGFPQTASMLRKQLPTLDEDYAVPHFPFPVRPDLPTSSAAQSGPKNEARSGEVPEATQELEGAQRISPFNCAPITYAGEWDK